MSLIPDTHPAWPVARITGDIDLSNVEEWTATLEAAVPNHALGLVVDLSGVTYLDSTGIRLLSDSPGACGTDSRRCISWCRMGHGSYGSSSCRASPRSPPRPRASPISPFTSRTEGGHQRCLNSR